MVLVYIRNFFIVKRNIKLLLKKFCGPVLIHRQQSLSTFNTTCYKRQFCSANGASKFLTEKLTRFNGVYVTVADEEQNADTFKKTLKCKTSC